MMQSQQQSKQRPTTEENPFFSPASTPSTPKETHTVTTMHSRSDSVFGPGGEAEHRRQEEAFSANRADLVTALDSTSGLVKGLQTFNQEKWTIHYPKELGIAGASANTKQVSASLPSTPQNSLGRASFRRSASMFTDEQNEIDSPKRPLAPRSYSTVETPVKNAASATPAAPSPHPLSILSLDLKLGHPTAPTASLPALLPSLSLATLSQLLSRRLTTSLSHLTSLRSRVIDTSSRILVTGDLNAGKSTLVNAILRRDVMPSDQQPCTTVFCEVLDASSYNEGKEELHAICDIEKYDASKSETYETFPLEKVNEVQENEDAYQLIKAYVIDSRAPVSEAEENPSFIKNGLVSISLIDAPGLNRDTLSTTALFARQSEIDVIVFVVSAENHFTLSAKEFLWNASREKAYVFIVVNKWSGIKDKARCMRTVGEQIKQLSPATWESRSELVHFVDAADVIEGETTEGEVDTEKFSSFDHLEHSLRSFVLLKRSKSKLAPAQTYLLNLLADLNTLAEANVLAASDELATALSQLAQVKPIHERLSAQRDEVEEGVDKVEETVVSAVRSAAWSRLERAMGFVSEGQVVPATPADRTRETFEGVESLAAPTELPPYPGLTGLWAWATEVKQTLVRALEAEVRSAEEDARIETVDGVKSLRTDMGNKYLPGEADEQKERVFRPQVMFAKRRNGVGRLASRGVATGLGLGAAGAGVKWSAGDFDVSFLDLFDLERFYPQSSSGKSGKGKKIDDDTLETGALVSLGLGGAGMLGSRLIGVKGSLESITRLFEALGSEQARKWAAPVMAVLTAGLVAYIIVDLPRAVPRNIGRKLEQALASSLTELSSSSTPSTPPTSFSTAHSDRIATETRKVLRLAGWDLRDRFRAALEKSALERAEIEGTVSKTQGALGWLETFVKEVEKENLKVEEIDLDAK